MPPIPIGRPYVVNISSGESAAEAGSTDPIRGTMRNHTRHEPAVMITAYFKPIIYPRPSTAAPVLSENTTLNLSAHIAPNSHIRVDTTSVHAPKVLTIKS